MRTHGIAFLLSCGVAACTHQLNPAAPMASVSINDGVGASFPVADGTELFTTTMWEGDCEHPAATHGWSTTTRVDVCDEKTYSVVIECLNPAFHHVAATSPCEIVDQTGVHQNRVERPAVRGTAGFGIKLHGSESQIIAVTLRHEHETYRYETPRLHVVVPSDFVVDCLRGAKAVPCDTMSGGYDEWLVVRSGTQVPLGQIVVGGRKARDGERLSLGNLVSLDGRRLHVPGDHDLSIDVNPPPNVLHRELTIHVPAR